MKLHNQALFFTYFRMSPAKYEHILAKVAPSLQKCSKKRDPICPSERLSVTFRYLFGDDIQTTIAASFCISPSSIVVGCMPLLFIISFIIGRFHVKFDYRPFSFVRHNNLIHNRCMFRVVGHFFKEYLVVLTNSR